jgi:hypothetical protein
MGTTPVANDGDHDAMNFCDAKVSRYQRLASRYGTRLWLLTVARLFFSIAVTVTSGIDLFKSKLSWVITVCGGVATLANGMLSATKVREYYLNAGSLRGLFDREKLLFTQRAGAYASQTDDAKRVQLFAERLAELDERGEEDWKTLNQLKNK